jgi:crotonobetainyl-CoA:carnitine CoA-transferase CaiB-like acyl-CoA transferase
MPAALRDMRVIDLSRLLPGPFATLCLQGLGATVIKVEDPAGGDYLRHMPPMLGEHGAWFAALNRGKRSVALDLKAPSGRDGLLHLLAGADVLVESFRPGVLTRLGLDPSELVARFPKLVVASLTGWGQAGPLAKMPGHDLGFLALAGMLGHGAPAVPRMQWGDLAAGGLCAALRIVAAHHARQGGWLDIAMLDGLIGLQQTQFATAVAGAEPDRTLTGGVPMYQVYRCRDGWVTVAALEPAFLAALAGACPEMTAEALAAMFAGGTRAEWEARLPHACVVPVLGLGEVAGHPQVAARALFDPTGLVHPPTGPVYGPVPRLGEHTAEELP